MHCPGSLGVFQEGGGDKECQQEQPRECIAGVSHVIRGTSTMHFIPGSCLPRDRNSKQRHKHGTHVRDLFKGDGEYTFMPECGGPYMEKCPSGVGQRVAYEERWEGGQRATHEHGQGQKKGVSTCICFTVKCPNRIYKRGGV